MGSLYLIDGVSELGVIRLVFYDSSTDKLHDIRDESYRPYFFVNHPLSAQDEAVVRSLNAKVSIVEKKDFFTGEKRNWTCVEVEEPSLFPDATKHFKERWEDEVPYILGYVYDCNLIFGALYRLENGEIKPKYEVSENLKLRFREKFSGIEKADPLKYEMLEHWFTLCSQHVPKIPLGKLGIKEDVDYEQLYLAFLLSRIANLPLPMALNNRQVSTWIKSILHFYMRRKNILIPRSSELRRGEDIHGVQGALTFSPKSGTYFNTVVLDFESLYPSLIDAYNLSYETVDCGHEECRANKVPGLEHYMCVKRRGIYSTLIGALKDLRIHWFKPLSKDKSISEEERRLAEAASKLLKLILVSCYGVTVRIHGLAQPTLAESITAYGRHALKESWDTAMKGGLRPIYGDTDSLFIDNPSDEQVEWLIKTVKENLRLDLAVDEVYSVCVLPRAMKAYFGVRKDGTPDVKGVTAIKSNSPMFIEGVFRDCVKQLINVKNWTEFEAAKEKIKKVVQKAVEELKAGNIPLKDLEYIVTLHFEPSEKPSGEEALHQPYQCAVQLMDLGREVNKGDLISFVKVKPFKYSGKTFTAKPTELVRDIHEVNLNDYVRNLRTALNQVFKPMDLSFREEPEASLADFI